MHTNYNGLTKRSYTLLDIDLTYLFLTDKHSVPVAVLIVPFTIR